MNGLILSRKLLVDPQELVTFVQHADEAAETRVFGFEHVPNKNRARAIFWILATNAFHTIMMWSRGVLLVFRVSASVDSGPVEFLHRIFQGHY